VVILVTLGGPVQALLGRGNAEACDPNPPPGFRFSRPPLASSGTIRRFPGSSSNGSADRRGAVPAERIFGTGSPAATP